ncbi:hypothetical protein Rleg2_2472 [Rhizobium leguminosarum bv. trifolii WSM2304]|uniref:Histidine kinase n=1 Tax=Rhizobium leguminosarum bv. trifolii (strain WSM2304) TaxID=395492 RepID=A0ABF7QP16_RHILW|nr:hypothetical protein [Rhizobium leguminosarum]ACI55746.1 hypothetical protein Rleg2_2472 [Rhizobium leguminosarum bv. trifolii WSM2304]
MRTDRILIKRPPDPFASEINERVRRRRLTAASRDKQNLSEIADQLKALAERAREIGAAKADGGDAQR